MSDPSDFIYYVIMVEEHEARKRRARAARKRARAGAPETDCSDGPCRSSERCVEHAYGGGRVEDCEVRDEEDQEEEEEGDLEEQKKGKGDEEEEDIGVSGKD